jgi:23S rRNA pseudouridine1911/1915/1917 synthase
VTSGAGPEVPAEGAAPQPRSWRVEEGRAGERLDRHVAEHLNVPRNQVQRWIRQGRVQVDGADAKASTPVQAGIEITVRPPPPRDDRIRPEEGELVLLHVDDQLIVVDKPAELTVHPGAGRRTGTLAHRLLARFPEIRGLGGPGRPGIVHRLDKDTTGVMVVARTERAYRALSQAFARRRVEKRYLAICHGTPEPPEGRIDAPIGRHPRRRKEMTVRRGARRAVTRYRVLASAGGLSVLELDLETGRTHQIRVHLKYAGHPLVGDPVYGEARWKELPREIRTPVRTFPRPALHAWRLAFEHPEAGRRVVFEAPVPGDLVELWDRVRGEVTWRF